MLQFYGTIPFILFALSYIVIPISSIPLIDLDESGYPNDFQFNGYASNGHYWFYGEWHNGKRKYIMDPPYTEWDQRWMRWYTSGYWGTYKPSNQITWVKCWKENLFDCNTIRYTIVATQSEGLYTRVATDDNGFNYYQRTSLDRFVFYDINASQWQISDTYNGSVTTIYDTCSSVNFFACEWVTTGRTANPTSAPTSPPTRAPTLPSGAPTRSPTNPPTAAPTTPTYAPTHHVIPFAVPGVPSLTATAIEFTMSYGGNIVTLSTGDELEFIDPGAGSVTITMTYNYDSSGGIWCSTCVRQVLLTVDGAYRDCDSYGANSVRNAATLSVTYISDGSPRYIYSGGNMKYNCGDVTSTPNEIIGWIASTPQPTTATNHPSISPTKDPSRDPSVHPSEPPTNDPSTSPTVSPSADPSLFPTTNPSLSPSAPTQFPSVPPTQNPTDDPTTAYPTLHAPIRRQFILILNGNFDTLRQYVNTTNSSMVGWAQGVIQMMINVAMYPQLTSVIVIIHSIARGSVMIDYSLEVDVIALLDLAQQNINGTAEIHVNENVTFPVTSNTIYTLNPTDHPTAAPTTTAPSQSPTEKPTKSPLQPGTTHAPTENPTKEPTVSPTKMPTYTPTTRMPSTDPTGSPTFNPTAAPTPQDIRCNDPRMVTETDGEYEYYLHIEEQSIVRFDTCRTLALFDIFMVDVNDTNRNYSCSECGSICHAPSQYQVTLSVGKYRMDINGPHAFKMICTAKPDTDAPTSLPTTKEPTTTPTGYPTVHPTTSRPTAPKYPVFNASFPGDGTPISAYTVLGDPYGRFEAHIAVVVNDRESVLGVSALCAQCFIWQYRLRNGVWTDVDHATNNDISVYNQQVSATQNGMTTYQSRLTIQSMRRLNAGRCFDANDNSRILKPGNIYELRLQFLVNAQYFVSSTSHALAIETNTLPSGGFCAIQDFENLVPLKAYNLFCDGWDNEQNLEYNALLKDTLMNTNAFVDDARKLYSVAPVGNVSITVMIKEKNVNNAITCYPIRATFKSIADTIHEELHQNTSRNASSIVTGILADVSSITNTTSFSDNPDVAVSIVTVIEDIYAENLTTKNEAAQIVDAIVGNILDGSGVLDIVVNIKNNSDNISWVVLESEILITELTTIAAITSNQDIVNAETTTTVLVDNYLPQIFEAIDVFVDISGDVNDNKTANESTPIINAKPSAIQDQLYTIAEQSQELIENLESTLQATLEAVEVSINETETEVAAQVVDNLNHLAQSLVDYAALAASKALSKSDVGETFNYETTEYNKDGTIQNKKVIIATKFDANIIDFNDSSIAKKDIILPKCGNEHQNIELPLSFMKQQNGLFDCAFMASSRSNFVSKQNRTQNSDTVSVNIYAGDNTPNEYESNSCFPYLITIQLTNFVKYDEDMSLGTEYAFPSCDFWNVTDSVWDTSGCFVYNVSNTTVTCGCTHLTTFSISEDEIFPEANILTEIDWRELTFYNLYHYPTVWLTCVSLLIVFAIICWINPRSTKVNTRSIMAFEDIIYRSVQQDKLWKDIVGKEIKYITDYMPNQHLLGYGIQKVAPTNQAKKSLCNLQLRLYRAYLRNDHTLLSLFQRTAGTNFSAKQRLGCFFMYLCNIMVVTATFYGLEQSTPVQDIFASFIISLCGTLPVLMVRKTFQKSKPLEVTSTKHILEDGEGDTNEADIEDSVPEHSPQTPGIDTAGQIKRSRSRRTHIRIPTEEVWKDFDMEAFVADNDDLTMSAFNQQIDKFVDPENEQQKIRAISDIRKVLFNKMFPLPHRFKAIAWVILVLWSIAACVTAIVYGFLFDLEANERELYQNEACWNTTLALQIETDLSKKRFLKEYLAQQARNASSYAGGDAKSWLLSIFQSLLTSLILWQPLTVYVVTWVKIWLFSWHLKMQLGPGNMCSLCRRCCCGYDIGNRTDDEVESDCDGQISKLQMLSQYLSGSLQNKAAERRNNHKIRDVVAHKNRPVDIISFLGNEAWIIDDVTNKDGRSDIVNTENHSPQNVEKQAICTCGTDSDSDALESNALLSMPQNQATEHDGEVELEGMVKTKSVPNTADDEAVPLTVKVSSEDDR